MQRKPASSKYLSIVFSCRSAHVILEMSQNSDILLLNRLCTSDNISWHMMEFFYNPLYQFLWKSDSCQLCLLVSDINSIHMFKSRDLVFHSSVVEPCEILTAVLVNILLFWDMKPCRFLYSTIILYCRLCLPHHVVFWRKISIICTSQHLLILRHKTKGVSLRHINFYCLVVRGV